MSKSVILCSVRILDSRWMTRPKSSVSTATNVECWMEKIKGKIFQPVIHLFTPTSSTPVDCKLEYFWNHKAHQDSKFKNANGNTFMAETKTFFRKIILRRQIWIPEKWKEQDLILDKSHSIPLSLCDIENLFHLET